MKKITPLFFIYVFLFHSSYSQNPTVVQWDHAFGGNGDDNVPQILQAIDSGYLLAGYSNSGISGDKSQSSLGGWDYWIIKTNNVGVKLWDKRFGGDSLDGLNRVITTSDGGFLLTGISYSGVSGDKTNFCRGYQDFWIVKIDANGNKLWDKTYGGNYQDYLITVKQTNDGGYILGGTSNSQVSYEKSSPGKGDFDWWVVKIDSLGIKQWDKVYGTNDRDDLVGINLTSDGEYILAGESYGGVSGDKSTPKLGTINNDYDAWVIKIDSLGNKKWDKSYGTQTIGIGQNMDGFNFVEIANDGGYVFAGSKNMDADSNYWQHWVLKTDTSGNILWEKTYGGKGYGYEGLWNFHKTNDNGFIISGSSDSPKGGNKTESNLGPTQGWILKIDSVGNLKWDKTILSLQGNNASDAIQTLDGGYAVALYSTDEISGEKTELSKGGNDYWLVKLTDKYNVIMGNAYYDFNSNQVRDSNDIPASYRLMGETVTKHIAITQSNGSYVLPVLDSGNYAAMPENISYYNSIPYSQPAYFSSIYQKDSLNDFAYQPTGFYNDLSIFLTSLTRFRPGRNGTYEITYKNVGTTILSGQVIFVCDSNFSFVSSDISPVYFDSDSALWTFSNISPFQEKKIVVTVILKNNVPTGTELRPFVRIEPVVGDVVPGDNYASWEIPVIVTNSYDPNDKLVSKDTLTTTQITSGIYLDYLINFQNTGNDTAFDVKILDNISPLLDMNSFEIVNVSHPMKIEYREASRLMIFEFNNILLPDSNINEKASHGFIRYHIKPLTTVPAGNRILNSAAIYFDFNSPVITDTAITQVVLSTDINNIGSNTNEIHIYPNPLTSSSTLQLNIHLQDAEVVIYDMLGKEMLRKKMSGDKMEIERGSLQSGVYFVRVNTEERQWVQKIVVE